ncbi:NAD-dependent epimerase/dehydratase family protein, partial [Candidatus Bipolaricaulota bacterium]|nr:NAD-dependent epimerase/dehydratase family protein [Candidatus Bipolaricaulota bacterium]
MRVLITGGTGLIGRSLTRELIGGGHEVVVLSRNPAGRKKVAPEVDMVEWDARTPEGWSGELEETDAVVNLAGENIAGSGLIPDRWTEEKKERILNSRLDAGNAVKEAFKAVDHEPEVLVQSS